jgi:hypothetical protein
MLTRACESSRKSLSVPWLMIWALSDCLLCFSLSGWDAVSTNHRISYIPGLVVKMAPLVLGLVSRCIPTSLCLSSPCPLLSSLRPFLRSVIAILAPYLPYRTRTELDLRKVFRSLCPRLHLITLPRGFDVGHTLHVFLFHISHACADSHPSKQSASGTACPYQFPALSSVA